MGNKSTSFAKSRMRENRNNQYRPEQQQMCREIAREFPEYSVLMEMPIRYKKEDDSTGMAVVDIIIDELDVVYRLNGAIHHSNTQLRS